MRHYVNLHLYNVKNEGFRNVLLFVLCWIVLKPLILQLVPEPIWHLIQCFLTPIAILLPLRIPLPFCK